MKSVASKFDRGDLLYSRLRPYLNKLWVADRSGACSGEFLVFRPSEEILVDYLAYCMHASRFVGYASSAVTGDRPRIDFAQVAAFSIPLPAIEVQRRIVARIDELFAEIEEGEQAMAEARAGVETYRKALLKAAITGELTADWRRSLFDRRNQPLVLLGFPGARTPSLDGLPTLPPSWRYASIEQLCGERPRNGLSIKETRDETEVKGLRLDALAGEEVAWDRTRFLPRKRAEVEAYALRDGDLLISRANGSPRLVGRACICRNSPPGTIFPDTAIRYRIDGDDILRRWILRIWNSDFVRIQIAFLGKTSAGILKISQDDIASIGVPIPPDGEYQQAERLLNSHLAECAQAEAMTSISSKEVSHLRQSILAAAFRGELAV